MKISLLNLSLLFSIAFNACSQNKGRVSESQAQTEDIQSDSFWKNKLSDQQYYILREKGTEKPYTGKWLMNKDSGYYKCAACGNLLFRSDQKFDSHCGWPSFDEQITDGKIITKEDHSHGMDRIEIMCAQCGGHLGHLFDDGPTETGKRYCVNSVSLDFVSASEETILTNDTIVLGGGCFWCIEAIYERMNGVISAQSGYSGGDVANPSYKLVCTGNTNHAEVVQIVYDPNVVSLIEILKVFFSVHNPTTLNQQGADVGTQYRSAIFYRNESQKKIIDEVINDLSESKIYDMPIVTKVEKFKAFYVADITHQDYYENNSNQSYCQIVIQPKIEKFEKVFKNLLKK
jgi:peptide methionine sulfoxide reductase msrA/msrB